MLPAPAGKTKYLLRIVYGFYGTVPSATHAQLSLIGWGNNGRWDQLAIGCWGETFCLDSDMSCTGQSITDVRALFVRNGKNGKKWDWSEAGWGGDWLHILNSKGEPQFYTQMKAAYLAHGPCLTEVKFNGDYGPRRLAAVRATVSTARVDDYARTFLKLNYTFNARVSTHDAWLFKVGNTHELKTPQIAYGNIDGLLASQTVPRTDKPGNLVVDHATLTGAGPWWVAFPDAMPVEPASKKSLGTASRALIIRSFRATLGGKVYNNPTISMPVFEIKKDGTPDVDLLLVPPKGITEFKPNDQVHLEVEWITPPRVAADYYGPNKSFRKYLIAHPRSWNTVYREAKGNNLQLNVKGATALHRYPIVIKANTPQTPKIEVTIHGGVGFVPIRFEGLASANGYRLYEATGNQIEPLDQSVHGNDFWQTEYDPATGTYRMSFNVPTDGKNTSRWVLKHESANNINSLLN